MDVLATLRTDLYDHSCCQKPGTNFHDGDPAYKVTVLGPVGHSQIGQTIAISQGKLSKMQFSQIDTVKLKTFLYTKWILTGNGKDMVSCFSGATTASLSSQTLHAGSSL